MNVNHLFMLMGTVPVPTFAPDHAALDEDGPVLTGLALVQDLHLQFRSLNGRAPLQYETSYLDMFAFGDVRAGSVTIQAVHQVVNG